MWSNRIKCDLLVVGGIMTTDKIALTQQKRATPVKLGIKMKRKPEEEKNYGCKTCNSCKAVKQLFSCRSLSNLNDFT